MLFRVLPVAAVGVVALALVIWLRVSSEITIYGNVSPTSGNTSAHGVTAATYAGCAAASPQPGATVTVTDTSGKIIGSGTLGTWSHATTRRGGVTNYICAMPFTIKNVPHEGDYGFEITNVPGTIWISDVRKQVKINLSNS